jgi:uncharacterized repeat protein (TIGR01451 family)
MDILTALKYGRRYHIIKKTGADATTTTVSLLGGGKYIDLAITGDASNDNDPSPGETYHYDIVVANSGTDVAFNVLVRDFMPQGTEFVSAIGENTSDFVCDESGGIIDCLGTLDGSLDQAPNRGPSATITVTLKAPKAHNLTYANQVRIDPANTVPEADETNNIATENVTVKSKVDLTTTISLGSPSSGSETQMNFKVKAKYTGAGPFDAPQNFVVVGELPVGVIPLDVEAPSGWTCQIEQNPVNKVTCTGSLEFTSADGDKEVTFNVRIYTTAQSETIHTNVVADPDGRIVESNEGNNTNTASAGV